MLPTFLKWAGGKRRILDKLQTLFPERIERYFEPFLGGGSVFFFVKKTYNPNFCMISDINKDLVEAFKAVRDIPKELIKSLSYFKKNDSRDFYYRTRERFNTFLLEDVDRCAAFIYMNKTCYNGLYRVNSKNEFNVPYGKYTKPEIYSKETITYASELLQGVSIRHQNYKEIKAFAREGDFVYLDPCYDPLKRTSFVNYTPKRFSENDRLELAAFIDTLRAKDISVVLSNNDVPEIRKLYSHCLIKEILSSRVINSNSEDRGKIKELAISI